MMTMMMAMMKKVKSTAIRKMPKKKTVMLL
jgi:hypothetical protein